MEDNIKQRFILLLEYLKIGQGKFEKNCGMANGTINNIKDGISSPNLKKILTTYPELNLEWLISGEGSMLKSTTIHQENAHIEGNNGGIGQVTGGSVKVKNNETHIHPDEGEDMVIERQGQQVEHMFKTLLEELRGFHGISERRDEYVKKQDEYIARIIKHSYLRNEENMKRMDRLTDQLTALVEMCEQQNKSIQDRADKLVDVLIKQLNK
jgi:hypothetical protein